MKEVTKELVKRAKAEAVIRSSMSKYEVLKGMKEILLKCDTTTSEDVQDMYKEDQVSSKIYTKKLFVGADKSEEQKYPETMKDIRDFEYVSLSCDDPEFKTALVGDIRVNCKNPYNEWVNVFASSLDTHVLRFLYCLMMEIMDIKEVPEESLLESIIEEFNDLKVTKERIKDPEGFVEGLRILKKACL